MKYINCLCMLLCCSLLISCKEEGEVIRCPDNFGLTASNVTNASCAANDGAISITSSGGQGAVSYRLDGGNSQSDPNFENLKAGSYVITAEDAEACTATLTVNVGSTASDISVESSTTIANCGEANGVLMLEASGGVPPYSYSLDGESFQSEEEFSDLLPGEYTVSVQDLNGCITEVTTTLSSDISYSAKISSIMSTNCAVNGCHVAGNNIPDFSVKANILNNAEGIKNRTASGSMPPGSSGLSLTDEQIEEIACWVDGGAPDN